MFFSFILSQSDAGGSINNPQKISLSIPSGVEIEVSGEVEVEFINVEGPSGAQNRDEFIQKVDYRSPFVEIDKTVLTRPLQQSNQLIALFLPNPT